MLLAKTSRFRLQKLPPAFEDYQPRLGRSQWNLSQCSACSTRCIGTQRQVTTLHFVQHFNQQPTDCWTNRFGCPLENMERLFSEEGFQADPDRALFGLCRYTAARISEVCQMKISDVFMFMPNGTVKAAIVFRTATTKGNYGQKTVKVAPALAALLAVYDLPEQGEYLFPGRHGLGHINPISASQRFKAVCDRLGLQHVSTQSFRRTAIVRLREAGFLLEEIQQISGHKSLDGLSHYLSVSESRLKSAVNYL